MKVLIAYGSSHGHTARIAARIAARLRQSGHDVAITDQPFWTRAADFDAVIVGARVHGTRYPWRITYFIRRNLRALEERPSAFFSVSLLQLSRKSKQSNRTSALPRRATAKLGWTPDLIEVFGGALRWKEQYGKLKPLGVWMWRLSLGQMVDSRVNEQVFTDWQAVDRFADTFAERMGLMAQAGAEQRHIQA
jgi:menaquinone-dependent protoporphyrinogen oxidase